MIKPNSERKYWRWRLVWNCLDHPFVYRAFSSIVGLSGGFRVEYIKNHIKPFDGANILDIGCGPGDFLKLLDNVNYVGFDLNAKYIAAAKQRFGNAGTFIQEKVGEDIVGKYNNFDIVMANGLLHHLNDGEVLQLLETAWNSLIPGGRLITLDGVLHEKQSKLAKYFVMRDRGRFMRDEAGYARLCNRIFNSLCITTYENALRIPYSLIVIESTK